MSDVGRIVVFGDVIDDVVVVPIGPIRANTDTTASIRHRPGGSAANTAAWLGTLGASVDFVGMVGESDVARHSGLLGQAGVTAHLTGDPELPTGTIVVIVEGDTRTMLTETGANATMTPDAVSAELLEAATLVHFTGYSLFGAGGLEALSRLYERCAALGVQISVDPGSAGFIADFGAARFLRAVSGADLIFPNLEEGRMLTGLTDPREIVETLLSHFEIVALTLDTAGVLVGRRGHPMVGVGAVSARVIDPTGAGDACAAGFLAEWVRSHNSVAAAEFGACVGARAVRVIGGRPG